MVGAASKASQRRDRSVTQHEGFLRANNWRWAKIASILSAIIIAIYAFHDPQPRPNGGTWYGYTLGTIGFGLILWLSMLGIRKRAMTRGAWSLRSWTSAHVYLGLALIIIGTLHTGFQFGWNIHTAAYALMMIVILSGIYGIAVYASLPRALSDNRAEMTEAQMLDNLRTLDRQIHDVAQRLDDRLAAIANLSLDDDPFEAGLWSRLSRSTAKCGNQAAISQLRHSDASRDEQVEKALSLLERKDAALVRVRRHLQLKALLEVWLYIHIPFTIALIASLSAHVISVFFYW